jgi:hypothetical protein
MPDQPLTRARIVAACDAINARGAKVCEKQPELLVELARALADYFDETTTREGT